MTISFDPYFTPVSDIEDLLLINASAGTGKTWMITHLAARWLLEEDRSPRELLMVTFTRAAAGELKSRLRERLVAINSYLGARSESPDADGGPVLWHQCVDRLVASAGLAVVEQRLRTVLSDLDSVHARTIHSFASAARQLDEAGLTSGSDVRRRAVHQVLTERVTTGCADFVQLLTYLEDDDKKSSGAAIVAERLLDALSVAEGAGGLDSGRVTFWRPEDDDDPEPVIAYAEELLRDVSQRLASLRALDDAVSFDGVIQQLHAEVTATDSPVAARLREQFGLVLIDEFQDTDALQWEIFDAIFRRGESHVPMILVGDPKQAIYGFRGGDVGVFQEVQRHIEQSAPSDPPSAVLSLTTNYRSSADLLGQLNGLFTGNGAQPWNFSTSRGVMVPYEVVTAGEHAGRTASLFQIRRGVDASKELIRDDVVAVVQSLVTNHAVAPSDIAILCRSRDFLDVVQRSFERTDVRTVSTGVTSVYSSLAATQLRTLLWILCDAHSARRRALLTATWFATLSPEEIVEAGPLAQRQGCAALHRHVSSSSVVAALLELPQGERHWTDLEQLWELLAATAPGGVSPDRLLHHLDVAAARAEATQERDDAAQRRLESDGDAVRLLTIHGAKGLQFPVVLVPQIERIGPGQKRVASWTTSGGRTIESGTMVNDASRAPFAALADEEESRRLMYVALTRAQRLLVAWDGGKSAQWPQLVNVLTHHDSAPPEFAEGVPFGTPDIVDIGDPVTLPSTWEWPHANRAVRVTPQLLALPPREPDRWRRWSYSALVLPSTVPRGDGAASGERAELLDGANETVLFDGASRAEDNDVEDEDDDAASPDPYRSLFGGRRGPELGNAVHAVLERAVGQIASFDTAALDRETAAAWAAHSLGVPPVGVVAQIAALLARPLGPALDNAALDAFVGTRTTTTEMRFTLPLATVPRTDSTSPLARLGDLVAREDANGPYGEFFARLGDLPRHDLQLLQGYLTGSIDLVAQVGVADAARFVIVDYKTNLLKECGTYEPDDLAVEMARSGYPLQALLYAVALHRYLRGRLPGYEPQRHLGSVVYYYLRGAAAPSTPASGVAQWDVPPHVVALASDVLNGSDG